MSGIIMDDELDKLMAEHDKQSGSLKKAMGGDNCWDAGLEVVKSCGDYDGGRYAIIFSVLADEKIKLLMKTFTNLEWLGYLVGEVNHTNHYVYVEDFIIPKQRVSYGAVTDVNYGWDQGLPIIGVIHSHHGMGAFFSGTDDAYINQNHDVSIVVATKTGREIKGQVRIKVKCGKYFINEDVIFAVNAPVVLDVKDFMKVISENITTPMRFDTDRTSSPVRFISKPTRSGSVSSRIGFVPLFDALDEDFDELDDIDDYNEEEDFVETVMEDIRKRDISTLGTPVESYDEDTTYWTPPVVENFKENIQRNKIGGWLFERK